jgi:hypothetical protein
MLDCKTNKTVGGHILNLLQHFSRDFFLLQVSKTLILCIQLYCMTIEVRRFSTTEHVIIALAMSWGGLCQPLLDKDFKQYLIICSPGVKHAWQLKQDISNTYSNMQ